VTESIESAGCGDFSAPCDTPFKVETSEQQFLAGIEDYTIRIIHSWQARRFFIESGGSTQFSGSSSDMTGKLMDTNGSVVQSFGGGGDIISLKTLLEASGTRLSDACKFPDVKCCF
jgi:hypothetical protein